MCGIVIRVREGRLVGRQIHYLGNATEESDEALLGALVKGFYVRQDELPPELLTPCSFEDIELVEEYLSARREGPFSIHVPRRGAKRDLVFAAQRNAAHALEQDRVESSLRARDAAAEPGASPEAAQRLAGALELPGPPRSVVCFDVSTLGGRESVGSAVWLQDGRPDKNEYRRFRIKESDERPDDYAMMQEIVGRYFNRRVREERPLPDLIVVDGGKGQLSAARQAMDTAGVSDLATVALAKQEEEVFRPGIPEPLRLARTDPGLHWLQRARDEAHRFALHYNRTLRRRRTLRSRLGDIPGVGPVREQELLRRFGSLRAVRAASLEQLTQTPGIGESTAELIRRSLAEDALEAVPPGRPGDRGVTGG